MKIYQIEFKHKSSRKIGLELVRARTLEAAKKAWSRKHPSRAINNAYAHALQPWEEGLYIINA